MDGGRAAEADTVESKAGFNALTRRNPKSEAGRAVAAPDGHLSRLWLVVQNEVRFWRGVFYDASRFRRHAWLHRTHSDESRDARMLADAHFLEYGMALREARPGFGFVRAARLARDLLGGGHKSEAGGIGLATLRAWAVFNDGDLPAEVRRTILELEPVHAPGSAGIKALRLSDTDRPKDIDYLAFAKSRHSVRQFGTGSVPEDKIKRAAEAAQHAPSSCNRQTCHLHVWTDPQMVERVRRHQAGNRTFGHELGGIAVVTSDLRHWEHAGERYQAWIDGGLFAMTFVHALHSEGLGTCMLNWSVDARKDRELRNEIGLDDAHLIIVLVGFGTLPPDLTVCASPRLPLATALSMTPALKDCAKFYRHRL